MSSYRYVIWSFEHEAWWAPNERGYVEDLARAGRYTEQQAGRIVTRSILGEEVAIVDYVAEEMGPPTVTGLWQGRKEEAED